MRLARNVAMLFGVAVPDAQPKARVRISDFNALTSADLGRGAPKDVDTSEYPDPTTVAAGTLSKFGPEPKAAITLTAANELFGSIKPDMEAVLHLIGLGTDAEPLADVSRIAAWAALLMDVYAAHPALLVAALKARGIQQGALESWTPWVAPDVAEVADRVEYGHSSRPAGWRVDPGLSPTQLNIVDGLMAEVVKPVAIGGTDADLSNSLLVEDAIRRFVVHLMRGGIDSGLVRINRDPEHGGARVDVALTHLGLLGAFTEANLKVFDLVLPVGGVEREVFDSTQQSHWERVLPRVPSEFEFLSLSPAARVAAVRVLTTLLRLVRNLRERFPQAMRVEARRRLSQLLRVARTFSEPREGTDVEVELAYLGAVVADLRARPAEPFDTHTSSLEAGAELMEVYRKAMEDYRQRIPPGAWLSLVARVSPDLSMYARDLGSLRDPDAGAAVHNELCDSWEEAFRAVGIDLWRVSKSEILKHGDGMAMLLHNWSALAMRSTVGRDRQDLAIELATDVVLPLRRRLAARRNNDKAYRFSLQTLGRGICEQVPTLPHSKKSERLDQLLTLGNELVRTNRVRELMKGDVDWTMGDVILAQSLARIAATQYAENATEGSDVSLDMVMELLARSHAYLATEGQGEVKTNERAIALADLQSRLQSIRE